MKILVTGGTNGMGKEWPKVLQELITKIMKSSCWADQKNLVRLQSESLRDPR